MNRIYLDHAATTPVDPRVVKAMQPYFSEVFGNPSSLHWDGQHASAAVFKARQMIAKAIGAGYRDIVFTGSATEANNLVLRSVTTKKSKLQNPNDKPKIITTTIEHESILETCRDLEKDGVEVVYVPVKNDGIIDLKKIEEAIDERTVLVSVMYANNEVGTIQPIEEIAKIVKGKTVLHTDASQAFQYLDCDVQKLGVDFMTLSAHKIYGPKGIGALYANSKIPNSKFQMPLITGGGQEWGLRSGTENVPAIVGFAKAVEINERIKTKEGKRIGLLRDYFLQEIKKVRKDGVVNGSLQERLPNNLTIRLPNTKAEQVLTALDLAGIAASSGSACTARSLEPSYVLQAMGLTKKEAGESIRFSFGRSTKKVDIVRVIKVIKNQN